MSRLVKLSLGRSRGGPPDPWLAAAAAMRRWIEEDTRADALAEGLPAEAQARARAQHLLLGALRHAGRVGGAVSRLVAREPRPRVLAALLVAGFELIEAGGDAGRAPKIVHHAVERVRALASPSEARLANALLRRLAGLLPAQEPGESPETWAEYFSHPAWLVRRWAGLFGPERTRALLEWNQRPAPVYARWRGTASDGAPPDWLKPASWTDFYEVPSGHWGRAEPLVRAGLLYVQDPSTALPVDLLRPRAGESVLDACAAPGGKSLLLADRMGEGLVVAADLPGPRIDRLKENLARARGVRCEVQPLPGLRLAARAFRARGLPETYPAVLLDAPCSNTGVMRRRVDARWRLHPEDFARHARQQLALLEAAAALVGPGGRLVYSTCSLDPEENEGVVEAFLARAAGAFTLAESRLSKPWDAGHDGAGAFLLRRGRRISPDGGNGNGG